MRTWKIRSSTTETGLPSTPKTDDQFAGWAGFGSEKKESEPEKFHSSVTEAGPSSAQGADTFVGWAGFGSEKRESEPEKFQSSVTEAGPSSAQGADTFVGWAGFGSEKKENEPEKFQSSVTEAGPSSAQDADTFVGWAGFGSEKKESEPEKPRSSVMESSLTSAPDTAEAASKSVPTSEKKKEGPEKPRSSITEAGHSNITDAVEAISLPKLKSENPEGEPQKLQFPVTAPDQPAAQNAATKADREEARDENGEEKPEPLGYSIIEPTPEPPSDFAKFDLRLPPSASTAATAKPPNGNPATLPQSAYPTPSGPVQQSAPNPIKIYLLAGVGLGLLFGCIFAFFSWRMSSQEGPYDLGPVTSSAVGLRGHLYIRWDKKLEYRLSFGPSAPEQQAGFALAVAHSPQPLSISIHLQDAQGFVLCSREVVLKYTGGDAPAPGASNPDAAAGSANAENLAGGEQSHGMQDLLAAQEAERELGKEVFKNEIGSDGQITGINAQGEIPCSEKAYANTSSWSFTSNFPPIAEQDEQGKHEEAAQGSDEHTSAKAGTRRKIAAIPPPVLLPFSVEGDDAIVDFDLSSGVIETRDNKTFFAGKSIGMSLDSRWLDYPVNIHYRCDQSSTCTLTHAGAGALRARLKR